MFSTWDIVRPRYWHPMASLEQSMMDMDDLASLMLGRPTYFPSLMSPLSTTSLLAAAAAAAPSTTTDDDDFFRDLPLSDRRQAISQQQEQQQPQQQQQQIQQQPQQQVQQQQQQQPEQSQGTFSSYSFSNSSIIDDKGRRVVSTRRRYEDSSGRLKAVHEREINGKKMRAVWNRMNKDDEGKHEKVICAGGGTPEEFEEAWKATPFGEAHHHQQQHQQQQQQAIKDTEASSSAKPLTASSEAESAQTVQP